MPRNINYPSYQGGGSTDDPERLYKMYLSALEDIDREISNYGTINMDDVYDFPSSSGAASAINREAGLERLFDEKRDLERSLRRQGKLLGYGGSKYRDSTMGSGRFPGISAIREEGTGIITDPNRLLARPERPLLPDFSQDPEYGRLRDKMGIKPTSAVMRRGFKGTGLKGLLGALGLAGLNPASALADVLMSPEGLGSGDLPEEDLLSDEEKMRYYDELTRQGADLMPRNINYPGYQEGGQVPTDIRRLLRRLMGGPGQEDTERDMIRAAIMRESRDLMGGEEIPDWLAENPELLQELLRSRPIKRPLPPLVTSENVGMMTPEEIKRWGGGNASGGIIGLQTGGPVRPHRRYRAGPEKLGEHAEKWRQNLEMDVLMGRQPYTALMSLQAMPGRSSAIEDLYTRALDIDPQIHPDSVSRKFLKEIDPDLYEKVTSVDPAQPVWEDVLPPGATPADSSLSALMKRLGIEPPDGGWEQRPRRASGGIIGLQQGGPAPQASRVTSYGVPQQTARQWAGLTDRIVGEGQRAYRQYGGQRLAGFTQPEAAAMAGRVAYGQGMGPMGTRQAAQTLGQAGQMIGGAQQGLMGLQPQYAQMAGQFGVAAPLAQLQAQQAGQGMGQLGSRAIKQGQLAGAGMRTTGTAGQTRQDVLGAWQKAAGEKALAAQQRFAGGLPTEEGLVGTGGMVGMGTTAQEQAVKGAGTMRGIGTLTAAPEMQKAADLSKYMSQYTAGVIDPQLQQLQEFQRQQQQELGSQAAQAGAFGGTRQGVQAAEQAKAASQQAADIIGRGQQEAFQSAQQAFEADRAAQAAGYGQQLTAEQQASAQEQQGLQAQMGAQQQAARMGDVGAARELQGLQTQLAAEQAGVGMSQLGQQQGFQAAQAGTQLGLGALQAAQGARRQGWDTYGNLLDQQQGALGAQGQLYSQMGGMGSQIAGVGGQQMQLGGQQQQQQLERLRGMEAAGEKQRQLQQQSLGIGYQDWQNQLNQERSNIGWQQAAMSGLPYKGTVTQSAYSPQVSSGASALATGIGGMGAYNQWQQNQRNQMPSSAWGRNFSPVDLGGDLFGRPKKPGFFGQTGTPQTVAATPVASTGTGQPWQPSGLGLSAGMTGKPSGLGLSAGAVKW